MNHLWTVLPFSGTEESIAFALALLLDTDTITFYDSRYASHNEFKLFRKDRLVEHYLFGDECGKDFKNDWDIKIENLGIYAGSNYEHRFKSYVRQVTEAELISAFLARKQDRDNRGFLDSCLKYYKAYIPLQEEIPHHYHDERNSGFQKWDSIVERMDIAIVPSDWSYFDWKVPERIT